MDFAPYQSSPPEHGRTLSPEATTSPRASWDYARRSFSPQATPAAAAPSSSSPPLLQHPQPQRAWSGDGIRSPAGAAGYQSPGVGGGGGGGGGGMGDYFGALGAREGMVSEFDTSLGLRLDYEACLAYLALPPLGAIVLLILEKKSDYVRYVAFFSWPRGLLDGGLLRWLTTLTLRRFHAWQSALLFTAIFVLHLIFSWSSFFSWLLLIGDLVLIVYLTVRAYRDVDTLDRYGDSLPL